MARISLDEKRGCLIRIQEARQMTYLPLSFPRDLTTSDKTWQCEISRAGEAGPPKIKGLWRVLLECLEVVVMEEGIRNVVDLPFISLLCGILLLLT